MASSQFKKYSSKSELEDFLTSNATEKKNKNVRRKRTVKSRQKKRSTSSSSLLLANGALNIGETNETGISISIEKIRENKIVKKDNGSKKYPEDVEGIPVVIAEIDWDHVDDHTSMKHKLANNFNATGLLNGENLDFKVETTTQAKDTNGNENTQPDAQENIITNSCDDISFTDFNSTNKNLATEWFPGDIVWAHMRGYPWWPALIENDPLLHVHTKLNRKSKNCTRSYHVEFFGASVLRGWVSTKSLMKFEGEEQYLNEIAITSAKSGNRTKLLSSCDAKQSPHRATWKKSVIEAEEALTYDREERRIRFGVDYILDNSDEPPRSRSLAKKTNKKIKQNKNESDTVKNSCNIMNAINSSPNENDSNKDVNDEAEDSFNKEQNIKNLPTVDGSFMVFLQKHEQEIKEDNPNLNDSEVERFLRQQWEHMSGEQKARYYSRFDDDQAEPANENSPENFPPLPQSPNIINSKRVHKPTMRFLEAAGNNIYRTPRKTRRIQETEIKTSPKEKNETQLQGDDDKQAELENNKSNDETNTLKKENSSAEILSSEEICPSLSILSNSDGRVDKLCQICDKLVDSSHHNYVKCGGLCYSTFHLSCVKLSPNNHAKFKCKECTSGKHSCFICKEQSADTLRCSVNQCGRFYHEFCLKKFPAARIENKGLICPLHTCVSCISEIPWTTVNKGRLVRCFRCPTAYHNTNSCLAAGTEFITSSAILCPRHYDTKKQINVNWCFICSSGGSLICCESCPAAFHAECLQINTPEGNYYCHDCTIGRQPKYDDIVWVKLGCYRWWPAQIRHPKSVPCNIQAIKHQAGEFPVKFFGSHDYYWSNRSRVFLYQEGDKGNETASNRVLAKVYEKALQEATEAFREWNLVKGGRSLLNDKPPPYKRIKTNKPIGKVQMVSYDQSEMTPCECSADLENPCSSDSDCLNRMVMFECNLAVCPAGDRCCNQRFQKRQYVDTVPFKTVDKGWGLKTTVDINKGQFVMEYVGELIDEEECRQRMTKMHELNITKYYFLTIDKDRIIDAGPKGNLARYMNHSCQPNCETQKWTVNGDTRVGLFAVCDIPTGTELTFNYNLDCLGNEKIPCYCKAPNCSGFIGTRPKSLILTTSESKKTKDLSMKKRKKKNLSSEDKTEHEKKCFQCKETGTLIPCDKRSCPKAYHLNCLKENKPSIGNVWECPWHICNSCTSASVLLCALCPNSFCSIHHSNCVKLMSGGRIICTYHETEKIEEIDMTECEVGISCINEEIPLVKRKRGRPKRNITRNQVENKNTSPDQSNESSKENEFANQVLTEHEKDNNIEYGEGLLDTKTKEEIKSSSFILALTADSKDIATPSFANQFEDNEKEKNEEFIGDLPILKREEHQLQRDSDKAKKTCRMPGLSRKRKKPLSKAKNGKIKSPNKTITVLNGTHTEHKLANDVYNEDLDQGEEASSAIDQGEEASSAIITVETDDVDGLELKPFIQKYKLENGEFSLEEYEESQVGENKLLN